MMKRRSHVDFHPRAAVPVAPPPDDVLEEILEAAGLEPLTKDHPER